MVGRDPSPRSGVARPGSVSGIVACAAGACAFFWAAGATAQEHGHHDKGAAPTVSWSVGAQAIGMVTHASPTLDGRSRTEGYLAQPVLMGHLDLWGGRVSALAELNLEGVTLRRGELNEGIWGEGYVDRRHPHTFVHELVVTTREQVLGADVSVTAGKGVVPFGTDDPMVRPLVKYPVNHHLAQILERALVAGAVRRGPLMLEAGVFNGDEPQSPWDFATIRRVGDSWAGRATLRPLPGVEAQASYARVESPEVPQGGGLDARKRSASARWERAAGADRRDYALVEWARTDQHEAGPTVFSFATLLAEGAVRRRGVELGVRWERTTRPEEERLLDPFRSRRPPVDYSILGITRWTVLTASVGKRLGVPPVGGVVPFLEVARARATFLRLRAHVEPLGRGTDGGRRPARAHGTLRSGTMRQNACAGGSMGTTRSVRRLAPAARSGRCWIIRSSSFSASAPPPLPVGAVTHGLGSRPRIRTSRPAGTAAGRGPDPACLPTLPCGEEP